jgi:hypothetical protein
LLPGSISHTEFVGGAKVRSWRVDSLGSDGLG